MRIQIDQILINEMESAARVTFPNEACGIIIGRENHINRFMPVSNKTTADPAISFAIDPKDYFNARRDAKEVGDRVMGIWHSHPDGLAEPSTQDKAQSYEGNWLWLITAISHEDVMMTKAYISGPKDSHEFSAIVLAKL